MERTQFEEIRCIEKSSQEYPAKLKHYKGMPEKLYVKGGIPDPKRPVAAVVGARQCSTYGRIQAFRFARILAEAGVQIISGLASGIDAEGHKGAMEGRMPTWAVLGNGADVCYPAGNKGLYNRIIREKGGIISEYPPGTLPRSYYFPARNRIIAGFSDLVLVVEAKKKSGSLITAQCALEQGKAVFALPGPVNEELSRGCHQLIYDGAGIAYTPEVLLEELGINYENTIKSEGKRNLGLASDLNMVYSCLDLRPKTRDVLAQESGFSTEKTGRILVELGLLGMVREIGRHYYIKNQT